MWRLAQALVTLRAWVNAKWPKRDRTSDGTIGDAAHASRHSDHNPWVKVRGVGVVRALDIDKDGVNLAWLFEELRKLGAKRDPRLYPGGYLILNRRITKPDFSGWATYTGSNPHTQHGHVSFSTNATGFDSLRAWVFGNTIAGGVIALKSGASGPRVRTLQKKLNGFFAKEKGVKALKVDGVFGRTTRARVVSFQKRNKLHQDGIVGPATAKALGITLRKA